MADFCSTKKDIISAEGIYPHLLQNLQCDISGRIFVFDSLESTNKTAKEMLPADANHGTIIIADSQTAGKGRYGRSFFSPPGHGLYMSLILHSTKLPFSSMTLATVHAAVSVCKAIEAVSGKSPMIKWVNDLFLNGKKFCGILTESVISPQKPCSQWIIIGIGINFDTPATVFPENIRQTAGSLFGVETAPVTRNHLAAEIINRVFLPGKQYSEKELLAEYKQKVFLLGNEVLVTGTGDPYKAIAVDIDDTGNLIVKKDTGEFLTLYSGDVSLR